MDLLVGKKPTLNLTQGDVVRTLDNISREVNARDSTNKSWQHVDMKIETDKIGMI